MSRPIGKIIREKREEKRWSQNYLANLLGMTPQNISSWELEKSIPTLATVDKLAELFNCSKFDLIAEGVEEPTDKNSQTNSSVDTVPDWVSSYADLAKAYEYCSKLVQLPPEDKKLIYSMIDKMVK